MPDDCTHLDLIRGFPPGNVCNECVQTVDTWVHLRQCTICGSVGCCDDSKNKHATKHFHRTAHPVIRSLEPGETWLWCYVDNLLFEVEKG